MTRAYTHNKLRKEFLDKHMGTPVPGLQYRQYRQLFNRRCICGDNFITMEPKVFAALIDYKKIADFCRMPEDGA